MNYPKIIGRYYNALGWICVLNLAYSLVTSYWTDRLNFDLSFILWFWLGARLENRSSTAWKWAVRIAALSAVLLVAALFFGRGIAHFGTYSFVKPDIGYYLVSCALFLLLAVPGAVLLTPRIRKEFASNVQSSGINRAGEMAS